MNYEALETEIVEVLNGYFASTLIDAEAEDGRLYSSVFAARVMPDNAEDLLRDYDKQLVNVAYDHSSYGPSKSMREVVQDETVTLTCYLQTNSMRGEDGGYRLMKLIIDCLLGYKPANANTGIWLGAEGGDWEIIDGETRPFLNFQFETTAMQVNVGADELIDDAAGNYSELGMGGDATVVVNGLADEPTPELP